MGLLLAFAGVLSGVLGLCGMGCDLVVGGEKYSLCEVLLEMYLVFLASAPVEMRSFNLTRLI